MVAQTSFVARKSLRGLRNFNLNPKLYEEVCYPKLKTEQQKNFFFHEEVFLMNLVIIRFFEKPNRNSNSTDFTVPYVPYSS